MQLVLLSILLFSISCLAQPDALWTRWLGPPNAGGQLNNVLLSADGSIAVAGEIGLTHEFVLAKLNLSGDTVWAVNGPDVRPYVRSLREWGDGNLSVVGNGAVNVIQYWNNGTERRRQTLVWRWWPPPGCTGSGGGIHALYPAMHGGYLSNSWVSMWCEYFGVYGSSIYRYDSSGNSTGSCISSPGDLDDITELADSTKFELQQNDANIRIFFLNSNGSVRWQRTLDESYFVDAKQALDCNGFLAVAGNALDGNDVDIYVAKLRSDSTTEWTRRFGGAGRQEFSSLIVTPNGDLVGCGTFRQTSTDTTRIYLFRLSADGELQWERVFDIPARAFAVDLCYVDGRYAIVGAGAQPGATRTDMLVMLTDYDLAQPLIANVSPVITGPPVWGYRLNVINGTVSELRIGPVCPNTRAWVGGTAAVSWTALETPQGPRFNSTIGAGVGVTDTFYLEHPHCAGTIRWSYGDLFTTASGPYSQPSPSSLDTLALSASDSGVVIRFAASNEQAVSSYHIWRSRVYFRFAQDILQIEARHDDAGPHEYTVVDRTPGGYSQYYVACEDIYGYQTEFREQARIIVLPSARFARLRTWSSPIGVHVDFDLDYVRGAYRIQILRWDSVHVDPVIVYSNLAPPNSEVDRSFSFLDSWVEENRTYYYYPVAHDSAGFSSDFPELTDSVVAQKVYPPEVAYDYSITAYPNPFNSSTTIRVIVPREQKVTVGLYDVSGRFVRDIVNQVFQMGEWRVAVDARDLPTGLYFARTRFSIGGSQVMKLLLIR